MTHTPLLRAPPFPTRNVVLSRPVEAAIALPDDIFARLREARVGGAFWAEPVLSTLAGAVVVRQRAGDDRAKLDELIPTAQRANALWIQPAETDPWSALEGASRLIAHGDDEWIAIARILGVPVQVLSSGAYGAPGEDSASIDDRVKAALSGAEYIDPFMDEPTTPAAIIAILAEWRRLIEANSRIGAACGMAWWKRDEIRRFLWVPGRRLPIVNRPMTALKIARKTGGSVAIWPSRVSPKLLAAAKAQDTGVVRVEDGFVRSVGLGSNLVPPSSVVVDTRGIHFDPSAPSDLEHILATTDFASELTARARALRETIVSAGISKYSAGSETSAPTRQPGKKLVLVPAQVEDDMSVLAGGGGLHSNLELLRRVRALEPDAEIWFRPHPDVDAGHRKGAVRDEDALQFADRIVRGGGMAPLLDTVDAVHVLTSLTGFEALMRGREVTCHGTPFYAGWGLTRDLGTVPTRRGRTLTLDQLVAGVLILYPRYLDPVTGLPCPPEVLIARMAQTQAPNRLGWLEPLRRLQGQFMARWR